MLDKSIEFDGSAANNEPDLGILKSNVLEIRLIQAFGHDYHKEVEERKKARRM